MGKINLIALNKCFLNLINNGFLYVEELNAKFSSATVDFHDMTIIFSSPFADSFKTQAIKCIYCSKIANQHIHTVHLQTFFNELLTVQFITNDKLD